MAHPDAQLPVDETVRIPEAVKRAAAAADAHYAKAAPAPDPTPQPAVQPANPPPAGDQPVNITAVPAPAAPAEPRPLITEPVQPAAPVPVPTSEEIRSVDYASEYNSMRGRWDQSQRMLGSVQEQLRQLAEENARLIGVINRPAPQKLLTPEDEKAYGPELIDMTRRAAREALQPELEDVKRQQAEIAQREQRLQNQMVLNQLDTSLPDWRTVNNSDAFKQWLSLRDVYSNRVRHEMLLEAFQAASVPRVLAFFNNYLAEAKATGQLPAPQPSSAPPAQPREAALPLVTLATPGRVQPASDTARVPDTKPHFTDAQVAEFYSHKGIARYVGREADRKADEQLIFEAQREGRIHFTRRSLS